jgi:hypothetical protein
MADFDPPQAPIIPNVLSALPLSPVPRKLNRSRVLVIYTGGPNHGNEQTDICPSPRYFNPLTHD